MNFFTSDTVLKEAVSYSVEHTRLYRPDEYPDLPDIPEVLNLRSFQTAIKFHKIMPKKKISVLNFSSEVNPGGEVLGGNSAQEKAFCRCSTLYPALNQEWLKDKYYRPNREKINFKNDDTCIYSEKIIICKTDADISERLTHKNFVPVDVITCSAPNLRNIKSSDYNPDELLEIHKSRAKHILHINALNDVDILISGAFGCGAYRNKPEIVAEAWKEALKIYQKKFDYIIFAVFFEITRLITLKSSSKNLARHKTIF